METSRMEIVAKHVDAARRRLTWGRFLSALMWSWFAAFLLAGLAIGIGKAWPPAMKTGDWTACCLGVGAALGIAAAAVRTMLRSVSRLDAACELDRRFELCERVSSALALAPDEVSTAVGQAVVRDAGARLERVRVADKFPIRIASRRAWLPLVSVGLAILVAWLAPSRQRSVALAATSTATASKPQVSTKLLEKKLAEKRALARQQGLENADALFKQLEDGARKLSEKEINEKKALIGLSDLSKDLDDRRKKLMSREDWKQQLKKLKDINNGPGDRMARAMKNGDFKAAADELKKLQDKLNQGDLNREEQQQLARQMAEVQKALDAATEAHEQTRRQLEQQLADAQKAGDDEAADRLRSQLDQHNARESQMKQMAGIGQELARAGDALAKGNSEEAKAALNQLMAEAREAQKNCEEAAMISEALDEVADAKMDMNGKEFMEGEHVGKGSRKPPPGSHKPGQGVGQGLGDEPGNDDLKRAKFYDSRVAQKVGAGRAVIEGRAEGPNRKGEAQEQIKARFASAERDAAADPLTSQRLPRDYREHAKKYFESLRDGSLQDGEN